MSRAKGTKNKNHLVGAPTIEMSVDAKIAFLANIIVDRIERDQKDGGALLQELGARL